MTVDTSVPAIEARGLGKVYSPGREAEVIALRNVGMRVNRGEFIAIMGPSGSGKSTLMNMIGCLDTPTSGTYLCEDVSILDFTAVVSEASGGGRTYTFKGALRVHSGVDQNVGLTLSLFEGTRRILMILNPKISAESGEDEKFTLKTTVPAKAARAIDEAKDLSLEITVRVKRD